MSRACRTMVLGLAVIGATMCATPDARAQNRSPYFPFGYCYPDSTGNNIIEWQGGDAPYGVYIQPNVSFWAWSDTYVGAINSTQRNINLSLHNTIAIGQTVGNYNGGNFTPVYIDKGTNQSPAAFFKDPAPNYSYQPRKSIMINGKLYVFLKAAYFDGSKLQYLGAFVARVNNPTANPTSWQVDTFGLIAAAVNQECPVEFGLEAQLFGTDPNNLYVYCLYYPPGSQNGSAPAQPTPMVITLDLNTLATTPDGGYFPQQNAQYLATYERATPTFGPGYGVPASGQQPNYFNTGIGPYFYSLRWNATAQKWQLLACPGLSAGPAQYPPTQGNPNPTPGNSFKSAFVWMSPYPFGPFNGSTATVAQLPAFGEFGSNYDSYVNQNYKYIYCAREWVDTSLTNDYQIGMTYTYSSAYLPDTVNDTNTYNTHFLVVDNPLLPRPANQSAASPHGVKSGIAALAAREVPVAVDWENTPAAATMPRPHPVPVAGFTPVEQRNPWQIPAASAPKDQAPSRGKGALKVR